MRACRRGDREAFGELVRLRQGQVFNLCLRLLGDREDAEDAAQDTFIKAYSGLRGWKGRGKFESWVYRIAVNVCHDFARRRARRGAVVLFPPEDMEEQVQGRQEEEEAVASSLPGLQSLEREEVKKCVHEALALLPEHYRSALVLFELEGLSYEEIAEAVGAPVGTVRSRLNRARLMFKERIKQWVKLE